MQYVRSPYENQMSSSLKKKKKSSDDLQEYAPTVFLYITRQWHQQACLIHKNTYVLIINQIS